MITSFPAAAIAAAARWNPARVRRSTSASSSDSSAVRDGERIAPKASTDIKKNGDDRTSSSSRPTLVFPELDVPFRTMICAGVTSSAIEALSRKVRAAAAEANRVSKWRTKLEILNVVRYRDLSSLDGYSRIFLGVTFGAGQPGGKPQTERLKLTPQQVERLVAPVLCDRQRFGRAQCEPVSVRVRRRRVVEAVRVGERRLGEQS
jgi:hypothetical protein